MVGSVQRNPLTFTILLWQVPFEAATTVEEMASSSHLSLEEEIDRFRFAEEERTPEKPMELSDFGTESDRLSTAHQPKQTIALVDTSFEGGENMDQKKRPSLRGLIANRNKGATPIEVPKAQVSTKGATLPPHPANLGLCINPDLKKKRPI